MRRPIRLACEQPGEALCLRLAARALGFRYGRTAFADATQPSQPRDPYGFRMPTDLQLRVVNIFHRVLLTMSGGRLGWRAGGMPVLELTTTGRRSGRRRTVMLTSPVREGDTIVVVGSRGGDDQHPAWFLNLRDHPDVEVVFGGEPKRAMRARVATPAERAVLWPRVTAAHDGYAGYQAKTGREIPLVLLEPAHRIARS
jgi:deazaflavin-dependent oxidoreductase (nitroreductase family)